MERSLAEAGMHLACLTVEDAFGRKLKRMQKHALQEDTYNSVAEDEYYEDAVCDKYTTQTTMDVAVGLAAADGENIHRLNRYHMLFKPVTRCAANYSHQIQLTDMAPVRCAPYKISSKMEKIMYDEVMKMLSRRKIMKSYTS